MEFDGKIAEITIEPETKRVISLNFRGVYVSFRCQRCAVFCCRLGGPKLLCKDIDRLRQAGYDPNGFLNGENTGLKSQKRRLMLFPVYQPSRRFASMLCLRLPTNLLQALSIQV